MKLRAAIKRVACLGAITISSACIAQALSGEAKICAQLHKNQQYQQAFSRCLKAANEGDVISQLALAKLYQAGQGVAQSNKLAYVWYLRAAKLRNPVGQFRVAQMYRDGIGVQANADRAKFWFEQAKNSGYKEP